MKQKEDDLLSAIQMGDLHPSCLIEVIGRKSTLLHRFVKDGDISVVRFFLTKGANVHAKISKSSDKLEPCKGATALHIAAYQGLIDIMGELLSRGASLEVKDARCYTPLNWAAASDKVDAVKFLLGKGADANGFKYVLGPLHFAAINGNKVIVEILLKKGGDVNAKTISQDTPLQLAASNGHIEIVEIFLENGANIDYTNASKLTPLSFAVRKGHANIIKLLLDEGANPDLVDFKGRSPLFWASYYGYVDIVDVLLKAGADPKVSDNLYYNPLHIAALEGRSDVVKLLLSHDFSLATVKGYRKVTALHLAVEGKHVNVVKVLLEASTNSINDKDLYGYTPLVDALISNDFESAMLLLSYNASLDLQHFRQPKLIEDNLVKIFEHGTCEQKVKVWNNISQQLLELPYLKYKKVSDNLVSLLPKIQHNHPEENDLMVQKSWALYKCFKISIISYKKSSSLKNWGEEKLKEGSVSPFSVMDLEEGLGLFDRCVSKLGDEEDYAPI